MTAPSLRTLVAVDGAVDRELIERALGDARVSVQAVGDPATGWPSRDDAEALLVLCADDSEPGLALVHSAVREHPGCPVVVACPGTPNGFLRKAFAAGAEDVVLLNEPARAGADTFLALAKAVARRGSEPNADGHEGQVITVLGPKGGTGKTLVTSCLAAALAQEGARAVAVDLDLQFGDVGLAYGLRPERTIYDLATAGGTLDLEKVEAFLTPHSSGARALLAPLRPDQAAAISPDLVRAVLSVLRRHAGFVVVDTPPAFTPEVIAAVDASNSVCLVTQLDAPSLKNSKIALETLGLLGIEGDRLRIVLNRSDSNVGISHADVVSVLGRAPDVLVPSSRDVVRAVNAGEPIVMTNRKSEPAKALRALAELYRQTPVGGH
ncbi:MAG TPA: AAA family ATPase [Baekduia sp.]|nr:AAA family ATPase [Baekduia sp.]